MSSHTCMFCKSPEVAFVEVAVWDDRLQTARELLLQGVCGAHALGVKAHPCEGDKKDAAVFVLYPELAPRIARMRALHREKFSLRQDPYALGAVPPLELVVGMRLYRFDSPEGGMVRAARNKSVDVGQAGVHAPTVEVERVPDKAALDEVVRDWSKR